jgi:hypothetical protein
MAFPLFDIIGLERKARLFSSLVDKIPRQRAIAMEEKNLRPAKLSPPVLASWT